MSNYISIGNGVVQNHLLSLGTFVNSSEEAWLLIWLFKSSSDLSTVLFAQLL